MEPQVKKVFDQWKKKAYKPVYWLEGEEPFFIDQVSERAEKELLTDAEAGFNLTIFYGRDSKWPEIVNACQRYPMFAPIQVVIIKEAQLLGNDDLEKLLKYIEKPMETTVLVVCYKHKKLDGRTKESKMVAKLGEKLTFIKLYDNQIPQWLDNFAQEMGIQMDPAAALLMSEHLGNDLGRYKTELEKMMINIPAGETVTVDHIELYVGISKSFNTLELCDALAWKNTAKCLTIVQYMKSSPKSLPPEIVLPTLFGFFSKAYLGYGAPSQNPSEVARFLGYNSSFSPYVKGILQTMKSYGIAGIQNVLLLLNQYNLKLVGVGDNRTPGHELLKELVIKILLKR